LTKENNEQNCKKHMYTYAYKYIYKLIIFQWKNTHNNNYTSDDVNQYSA